LRRGTVERKRREEAVEKRGDHFCFSQMVFLPHPVNEGMKAGGKDGEREKERGGRRGGCSRRAL